MFQYPSATACYTTEFYPREGDFHRIYADELHTSREYDTTAPVGVLAGLHWLGGTSRNPTVQKGTFGQLSMYPSESCKNRRHSANICPMETIVEVDEE